MDVQEAVKAAFAQVQSLYAGQEVRSLQLEEVEKDGLGWQITLSFARSDDGSLAGVFAPKFVREYKTVELSPTGELKSMKIRKL